MSHEIPAKLPQTESKENKTVNNAETILQDMLLRAGFPVPKAQYPINLGKPLGTTTPDFFYEDPDEASEGICIYLDGMSQNLHGNPERQQRDRDIRDELENLGYEVFTITASNLSDHQKMAKHFFRIGRILLGKEKASKVNQVFLVIKL